MSCSSVLSMSHWSVQPSEQCCVLPASGVKRAAFWRWAYFCRLCFSFIFQVVIIGWELVYVPSIKSCKLHAEQQNVLPSAKTDHSTFYLGRLSVSVPKIYFKRQKPCSLLKSSPHSTAVCHVLSCIIKQLWQSIWNCNTFKSKEHNFTARTGSECMTIWDLVDENQYYPTAMGCKCVCGPSSWSHSSGCIQSSLK